MRLTLRYLLAYLDDQLEPADAQSLNERIEASQFATDLMHRVRDVSRRLKLGAPKVKARGLAGDANTVAEYLDHTMPVGQVTEFEKICLTSDVHLAEVASAHQILALVLGEPAAVDQKLRRRMYSLPNHDETIDEVDEDEVTASPDDHDGDHDGELTTVGTLPRRRRPEIPDWLRDQPKRRSRWLPVGALALGLVAVGAATYLYFGHPGMEWNLASLDEGILPPVKETTTPPAPTQSADVQTDAPAAAEPSSELSTADTSPIVPVAEAAASEPTEAREIAREESRVTSDAPSDDVPPAVAGGRNPLRLPVDQDSAFNTDVPPEGAAPRGNHGAGMPGSDEAPTALDDQALVAGGGRRMDAGSGAAVAVGRLTNENDIMLHAVPPDGAWTRLSTRDALLADEELVALPTFRPGIALSTGGVAIAHMLGGSIIRLMAPDENGVPGLHVIDGQVVVATAGKPGTQLNLQVDGRVYLVTFLGTDTRIALDAHRWLPDGADPLKDEARTSAVLYVPNGDIEYLAKAGVAPETLKAPAMRSLLAAGAVEDSPASAEVTFPAWINGNPLSQMERQAVDFVNRDLIVDEPVQARLRALAESRRYEVRNLAVHCLTLLGDFEALLPLLNDEKQKINWSSQIEGARDALARSPELAKQLKETLESQRDAAEAQELYEMLRGFSRRELQDGAAARLVANLDHEDLDFRVLAFWNLQRVSAGPLGYKPEYSPAKRQDGLRAWRRKLAEGQIVPKSAG
ncbi:MAG TPA: hypothetical protein VGG64_29475 [Pirellulales bacterium]